MTGMRRDVNCIQSLECEYLLGIICDQGIREELVRTGLCTVFIDVTKRYNLPTAGLVCSKVGAGDASASNQGYLDIAFDGWWRIR
jgi:hypothetical protein